jgi:hypothetical protein
LLGLDGGCAPQLRAAQYARFRIDAPHRTEVPSEAFTHCLKDLWRRFRKRCGVRQDTCNAVLHEQAVPGASALGHIRDPEIELFGGGCSEFARGSSCRLLLPEVRIARYIEHAYFTMMRTVAQSSPRAPAVDTA